MDAAPDKPRFLVDRMLGRLGKYLRCAGYDALVDERAPTRKLIERADGEGRIFLTRNTRLGRDLPVPDRHLAIKSDDPVEQFRVLVEGLDLDVRTWLFTRCIRCNVDLAEVHGRETVRRRVPEAVFAAHERFWTCPSCGTLFWHGSHVENTCRKLGIDLPRDRIG